MASMKKKLLIALVLILTIHISWSQDVEIKGTIFRSDYEQFYLTSSIQDTFFLFRDSVRSRSLEINQQVCKFVNGRGGSRDEFGVKERKKTYLISSKLDTLATLRYDGTQIQFKDGSIVRRKANENGWFFLNAEDEVITDIELFWNYSNWNFSILNFENKKNIDPLNKVIMLSLVNMAHYRSECHCDDEVDFLIFLNLINIFSNL